MKFKDLKKSLIEKIDSCYLLSCGNDEEDLYLKASAKNNLIKAVISDFKDLNLSVFQAENIDVTSLKKSLETMPFMSKKRLVLIIESENKKNEQVVKFLNEYLKNPNETTVLVIDECVGSAFKILEKNDVTNVDCSRLDRDILSTFILKNCKSKNIDIDLNVVNKLIDFCDGYIVKINIELDKLLSYKFDERVINLEDIEKNVTKSEEYQIFELTNALFNKDSDKALFIVDDIIKNKKNIGMILNLIYNHIRRLFYVKISKLPLSDTAGLLEIKEFAVKKLKEQTEKITAKKLKEILSLCEYIDFNIKSGTLDLISGIYNLIFAILI